MKRRGQDQKLDRTNDDTDAAQARMCQDEVQAPQRNLVKDADRRLHARQQPSCSSSKRCSFTLKTLHNYVSILMEEHAWMGTGVASTGSPPSLPMPSMRATAVSLLLHVHVTGEVLLSNMSGPRPP